MEKIYESLLIIMCLNCFFCIKKMNLGNSSTVLTYFSTFKEILKEQGYTLGAYGEDRGTHEFSSAIDEGLVIEFYDSDIEDDGAVRPTISIEKV